MSLRQSFPFESITREPQTSEWNHAVVRFPNGDLNTLRRAARQRLIQSAAQFSQRLDQSEKPFPFRESRTDVNSADEPALVLTGHQPVHFHPGLVDKYLAAEEFCEQHNAIGIALIIDSDEGDCGVINCPALCDPHSSSLWARSVSLSEDSGVYAATHWKTVNDSRSVIESIRGSLIETGCASEARNFSFWMDRYLTRSDLPVMLANTWLRRQAGIGTSLAEIPFTAVCAFPEVMRFFASILQKAHAFVVRHNAALQSYRSAHQIRNHANPFPDLVAGSMSSSADDATGAAEPTELPFWLLDRADGTRRPVSISGRGVQRVLRCGSELVSELPPGLEAETLVSLMVSGKLLVPRGALISATLRLLFADLFLHGTGGGNYDQFTDQLIREWWHVEPPPYAVASGTARLFAEQRRRLEELRSFSSQLRDMQYNPQRWMQRNVFSEDTARRLEQLILEKDQLVEELKSARTLGRDARDTGTRIQTLTSSIRDLVSNEAGERTAELSKITPDTIRTWESRTWPWFYFVPPAINENE